MTLEQLFSEEVSRYIVEINQKYPDITDDEFRQKIDEFVEKNKEQIALNESNNIDFDEFSLNEAKDFSMFDDEEDDEEEDTELEGEVKPEKKEPKSVTTTSIDSKGKVLSKITVDKVKKEEMGSDYRFKKIDGKEWLIVNNKKDPHQNIHKIVDIWYNRALKKGTGENEQRKTALKYLWCDDVTDMSALFAFANVPKIDLSHWNTAYVETMEGMFYRSTFNNKSIEEWEVGSCKNFRNMFVGSRFAGDISSWTPGTIEEEVFDPETGAYEYIEYKDPETGETRREKKTRFVTVKLPVVGARLAEIEGDTDEEIGDTLGDMYGRMIEDDDDDRYDIDENVNRRHVLSLSEFVNEGFYDKVRGGVKKGVQFVKNKIKMVQVKLQDFYVATINPINGKIVNAISPITTINYINKMRPSGVSVFSNIDSNLLNDSVDSVARIEETDERYGWIEKGSIEYKNYIEFNKMLNGGSTDVEVSEARVPLSAVGSGLNNRDIDKKGLEDEIRSVMINTPSRTGRTTSKALCIYGAPGIGKTSIPKAIIKQWNKDHPDDKKSLIVIQCGDLELGGFNIPMPKDSSLASEIYSNRAVMSELKRLGVIDDDKMKDYENASTLRTFEAPKTWLPVYYTKGTEDEITIRQALANGRRVSDMVYNEKTGKWDEKFEETTGGGIIMFDEFLRADPELFKTISQLIQERTIGHGEYKLGTEWGIILCSNRPCDDDEVEQHYKEQSAAMGNRYLSGIYNFLPDFYDWLGWAKTDGHFDDSTIKFLSQDAGGNKEVHDLNGLGKKEIITFKNWHTIDKEKFQSGEEPIPTTPRGWAAVMEWVEDEKRVNGYESIFEVDFDRLRDKACAVVGSAIGNAYVDFMEREKRLYLKGAKPKTSKFFSDEIEKIDKSAYSIHECTKDIEGYVKEHFTREFIESGDSSIGEMFLTMAKNVDRLYEIDFSGGTKSSTEVRLMHNNIISKIIGIHKRKEDKKLFMNMRAYLEYVCDDKTHDIDLEQ